MKCFSFKAKEAPDKLNFIIYSEGEPLIDLFICQGELQLLKLKLWNKQGSQFGFAEY